eukprot:GHVU01043160.1.p1 GENE.GHVU01043160.1~~GHVU01043160.1.p1  ORF type:complete len:659 (+),score=37.93 GHVU01043160.1:144-2120(+)
MLAYASVSVMHAGRPTCCLALGLLIFRLAVRFLVDTGANISLLAECTYDAMRVLPAFAECTKWTSGEDERAKRAIEMSEGILGVGGRAQIRASVVLPLLLQGKVTFEIFYVLRDSNVNLLGCTWLKHVGACVDVKNARLHMSDPAMSIELQPYQVPQEQGVDADALAMALTVAHSPAWTTPQAEPPKQTKILRPTAKRPKLPWTPKEGVKNDTATISGEPCGSVCSSSARSAIFPPRPTPEDVSVMGAGLTPSVGGDVDTGLQPDLQLSAPPVDVARPSADASSTAAPSSIYSSPPSSPYPPRADKAVNPDLPSELRTRYLDLLMANRDVWEHPKVGTCKVAQHHIYIQPNTHPIAERARKHSPEVQQAIFVQLQELVKAGAIASSESDWASNVVMVPKKNGNLRLCLDYRRLNAVTIKDAYPMQRLDDALRALEGASCFTVIDMQSGFHQMQMAEDSRDYTAFITPFGLFCALVMMFGLSNAPKSFQRVVDRIFHDLRFKGVGAYIDDIAIYADGHEQMLLLLVVVCERLRAAGMYGNIEKNASWICSFRISWFCHRRRWPAHRPRKSWGDSDDEAAPDGDRSQALPGRSRVLSPVHSLLRRQSSAHEPTPQERRPMAVGRGAPAILAAPQGCIVFCTYRSRPPSPRLAILPPHRRI